MFKRFIAKLFKIPMAQKALPDSDTIPYEPVEKPFIEHQGKKYFLNHIPLKDFIRIRNFCLKEIDTINLVALETDDDLAAAGEKWEKFCKDCFGNADEAMNLSALTGKEMGDIKQNFFYAYQGIDRKALEKAISRLRASEKATK